MKVNKLELRKESILLVAVVVVVILAVGAYIFIYAPLIGRLKVKHAECRSVESDAAKSHLIIGSSGKTYGERVLITETEVYLAIDELTRLGKGRGINFLSITPKGVEKNKELQYKVLPIGMKVESSYENLALFMGSLDELEKSVAKVRSFDITPDKKNPNEFITALVVDIYISGRE